MWVGGGERRAKVHLVKILYQSDSLAPRDGYMIKLWLVTCKSLHILGKIYCTNKSASSFLLLLTFLPGSYAELRTE
jgi:hypothetical protein